MKQSKLATFFLQNDFHEFSKIALKSLQEEVRLGQNYQGDRWHYMRLFESLLTDKEYALLIATGEYYHICELFVRSCCNPKIRSLAYFSEVSL